MLSSKQLSTWHEKKPLPCNLIIQVIALLVSIWKTQFSLLWIELGVMANEGSYWDWILLAIFCKSVNMGGSKELTSPLCFIYLWRRYNNKRCLVKGDQIIDLGGDLHANRSRISGGHLKKKHWYRLWLVAEEVRRRGCEENAIRGWVKTRVYRTDCANHLSEVFSS